MKYISFLAAVILLVSCKETPKEEQSNITEPKSVAKVTTNYPEALRKVFEAHGGIDQWTAQRTLSYDIPKNNGMETHTLDLKSRKDRIDAANFSMGFNGEEVWLSKNSDYNGDPIFYHNLMSYFYAMPFILGDKGINYGSTEDLVFEGVSYPGIRISYDLGVGASPKDEYYIHYDKASHQMTWLGYTVTYRSGEKSDNIKWIRYNDWGNVSGLRLPKSITWHAYEGRAIKEARSTVTFENIRLSESSEQEAFYAIPEDGRIVEGKK